IREPPTERPADRIRHGEQCSCKPANCGIAELQVLLHRLDEQPQADAMNERDRIDKRQDRNRAPRRARGRPGVCRGRSARVHGARHGTCRSCTRPSSTRPSNMNVNATPKTPIVWLPDAVVASATSNGAAKLEARPTIT